MIENLINAVNTSFSVGVFDGLMHVSFIICLCLAFVWGMGIIICGSVDYIYEDKEGKALRKMFPFIANCDWGYRRHFVISFYSFLVAMGGLLLSIIVLPLFLYLLFYMPWLVVGVISVYATLRLARAVVRLKNKLSSHMADINAHKEK